MPPLLPRLAALPALAATLAVCGCGDPAAAEPEPFRPSLILFDFGTIRHGAAAEHVYEVPVPDDGLAYRPLAYHKNCSCGVASFSVRAGDGEVREAGDAPLESLVVRPGETLLMRLRVDTGVKEAVDQDKVTFEGNVILQDAAGRGPRVTVPVAFSFAIDAPVEVRPVAHVDFGALPRSRSYSQVLELHPDRTGPPVALGPARTSAPHVAASLREDDGVTLLDVAFRPRPDMATGPVRERVLVATDLPGDYAVPIPVTGTIIPDVLVEPTDRIGFNRIDFARPAERFVQVIDHDLGRQPGFRVLDVVDPNGVSLAEHFEVRLEPLEGAPRTTRMTLRYLGNLRGRYFRGRVRLAKPGDRRAAATVHFVGYNSNQVR